VASAVALEYTPELLAAEANASIELEVWRGRGQELAKTDTNRQFEIGDWLHAGYTRWQRKAYSEALTIFKGYNRASLRNLASVAKQVPTSLRNDNLSWNHHVSVAKFSENPDYQKKWLEAAVTNDWSSKQLRVLIKEAHPPVSNARRAPAIQLCFAQDELKNLEILAHSRAVPINRLVRDVVAEYLRKPEIVEEIEAATVLAEGNENV
jgi:hypothetical protein